MTEIRAKQLTIPKGYYYHTLEEVSVSSKGASIRKVPDRPAFHNTLDLKLDPVLGGLGFVEGATYPRKGYPEEGSVYAINIIKELIKQTIKHPLIFVRKEVALKSFIAIFDRTVGNYRVTPESMCPTAKAFSLIVSTFLNEFGIKTSLAKDVGWRVAHLLEYDDAYRYRVQDMATACRVSELIRNPRKEVVRLIALWEERDTEGVTKKMKYFAEPFLFALYFPSFKKALKKSSSYIKNMVYDDADFYWASLKYGYHYGGQKYEERIKNMKVPQIYTTVDSLGVYPKGDDTLDTLHNNQTKQMRDYTQSEKEDILARVKKAQDFLTELNLGLNVQVLGENIGDDRFAFKATPFLQDTKFNRNEPAKEN